MAEVVAPPIEDIPDAAVLWRRIPSKPGWIVPVGDAGDRRPSSGAFEDDQDGSSMSMYLEGHGNEVADVLRDHESYGLVALTAGQLRELGLTIVSQPEPGFPSHVEVEGNKTHGLRSKLAKRCRWVVLPP